MRTSRAEDVLLAAAGAMSEGSLLTNRGAPRDAERVQIVRGLATALSVVMRHAGGKRPQIDRLLLDVLIPASTALGSELGERTLDNWRSRYAKMTLGTKRVGGGLRRKSGARVGGLDARVYDHVLHVMSSHKGVKHTIATQILLNLLQALAVSVSSKIPD
jgi:hypothetical protein